jgi:hypothetical protein
MHAITTRRIAGSAVVCRSVAVVLFCWAFGTQSASAQIAHTPPAGSAERKAIMDVLREPCEQDLRQKVVFRVQHLRVAGDWAFARVVPIRPDGKEIDYSRTKYAEAEAEGAFDAEGEALLRRTGESWKLLEWRFGATDTEVDIWLEKHRFPRSILN